jgi:hypothetical protein
MKCSNIAGAFGMTVKQFADACGYSRQTLYCGEIRDCRRARAMLHNLKGLNESMLRMDMEEAQRKFELRTRAVEEFEKQIENNGVKSHEG